MEHLKIPQVGLQVSGAVGWHKDPRKGPRPTSLTAAQSRLGMAVNIFLMKNSKRLHA